MVGRRRPTQNRDKSPNRVWPWSWTRSPDTLGRWQMLDLWLVRHAESLGNLDGSDADVELSTRGREQAASLAAALAGATFSARMCSPLLRARETAQLADPTHTFTTVRDLRELEPSRTPTFVDTTDGEAMRHLLESPHTPTETGPQFMTRVAAWLASLPREGSVLAITHTAVIREVTTRLLGFRRAASDIGFASIFRFAITASECTVVAWNDVRHIRGEGH